jgi:hypothetical protein
MSLLTRNVNTVLHSKSLNNIFIFSIFHCANARVLTSGVAATSRSKASTSLASGCFPTVISED